MRMIKRLAAIVLFLTSCASVPSRHDRQLMLIGLDDPDVVAVDPGPYFDADGRLQHVIVYRGRTYERGYTNWTPGDGDDRERLWFEVDPCEETK